MKKLKLTIHIQDGGDGGGSVWVTKRNCTKELFGTGWEAGDLNFDFPDDYEDDDEIEHFTDDVELDLDEYKKSRRKK